MNKKNRYYFIYTVVFAITAFCCFGLYLMRYNKSILRSFDTYDQLYLQFIRVGQWLRSLVLKREVLLWDHSIGYGADFLTTMNGFITDPLNWLSVFFPARYAEVGYTFVTFLRYYLCGITFSVLGFRRKQKPYAILCGAIIYTFCACAYVGFFQAQSINPVILFPLLICGADELFEKKKSPLYVVTLTLCAYSSFYYTYMMAILIIIYCFLKWIFTDTVEKTIVSFLKLVGRFALYSVLCAGMAAVVLLPVAHVMLSLGRLDLDHYVPVFYDKGYYANLYRGFVETYDMGGRDCKIGYSVLGLASVFALLSTRSKENRQLKLEFVLMTVGLCLPYVGHVMNGFGYVANRWIWAYALVVAFSTTVMLEKFPTMHILEKLFTVVLMGLYVFFAYQEFYASGQVFLILSICLAVIGALLLLSGMLHNPWCKWLSIVLGLSLLGLYLYITFDELSAKGASFALFCVGLASVCLVVFLFTRPRETLYRWLAVGLTCVTVSIPATFQYSSKYVNDLGMWLTAGIAYDHSTQTGGLPLLVQVDSSDGTRYNHYDLGSVRNASWLYGVSGIDFYMSLYNNRVDDFHNSIALNTSPWNFGYEGLDRRSELLALLGVNHFFTPEYNQYRPVGFDLREAEAMAFGSLLEYSWKPSSDNALFYRFRDAVSYDEYESLTPYERQQLLMRACVLEDEATHSELDKTAIRGEELEYELSDYSDGVSMVDGDIYIPYGGCFMEFSFGEVQDAELYVFFEGIDYDSSFAYTINVEGYHNDRRLNNMFDQINGLTPLSHMYGGKHNWMLNLGLLPEAANKVRITFLSGGHYMLKDLHLYARDVNGIRENINALNRHVYDIKILPNQLQASVENKDPEFLFVSVPYSIGWRVFDGDKELEVLCADVAFMAVQLEPGQHEIRFIYRTPWLRIGTLITAVSLLCYVSILVIQRKKRKALAAAA